MANPWDKLMSGLGGGGPRGRVRGKSSSGMHHTGKRKGPEGKARYGAAKAKRQTAGRKATRRRKTRRRTSRRSRY